MRWIFALAVLLVSQLSQAGECRDLFAPDFNLHSLNTEISRPALYTITKNGRTSFLFGTFPKGISAQALPKLVYKAINRTFTFVSDFNPDQDAPPGIFDTFARLPDQVSESTWKQVKEQFEWAPEELHPALPYIDFLERSQREVFGEAAKGKPDMAAELRKYARMRGAGTKIEYLENTGDVIQSYIDSVTPELLEWTFTAASRGELQPTIAQSWAAQAKAYQDGNMTEFERVFEKTHKSLKQEALLESVVKHRNRKWIARLNELHANAPFFFAVEVGHLGGESGLIELLAEEGYWIRRVSTPQQLDGSKYDLKKSSRRR